jgi:molybdopterin-biosynthesis enzyme MoeA-like protein
MSAMQTAAALIIGNEILGGKIQEANIVELAHVLRRRGVVLARVLIIPDVASIIAAEVLSLSKAFDHVFTSGGVGPTHDDVTMASIATAFGVEVVAEPRLEKLLRHHYGDAMNENHLLLANVPAGARQLTIGRSAWPLTVFRNVWILPGVPEIFRMKLAIVEEHLEGGAPFVSRAVFTKLDEAELKPLLDTIVARHPDVDVGSYPRWQHPQYETKITFDGTDPDAVERAFEDFQKQLPDGEPQWTE